MQPVADPYRALGVPRGASEADIKAAHRRLAKRYHPDAANGDASRFLKVQEAYRVLSDPLLRREWDAKHAGPVRADRPVSPRPRRAPRARSATEQQEPTATEPEVPRGADPARPRSSRAYTWKATEVPWWEEGAARRNRRRRRSAAEGAAEPHGEPQPGPPDAFDVYNRSSGAAWSMAARAYFRRGDQDLPRRGSFHHEGTQPLTAARARAAAEAEARRRAAAPAQDPRQRAAARGPAAPAYAYATAGVARDPERVAHVREEYMRRTRALKWPSLRQRLLYALIAWLPIALLFGYGAFATAGCGTSATDCPPALEVGLIGFVGLLLVLLVVLPKIAYVGAMGTTMMLVAAAVATGVLAYMRAPLPPAAAALIVLGVVMVIAYVATVLVVALRGGPWRWAVPR